MGGPERDGRRGGPLLGGGLVDTVGWRWVFLVNVPIAAVIAILLVRHAPESRADRPAARFDLAGALLAAVGLGGVTYALIQADGTGWLAGAVGLLALVGFVQVERRTSAPICRWGCSGRASSAPPT